MPYTRIDANGPALHFAESTTLIDIPSGGWWSLTSAGSGQMGSLPVRHGVPVSPFSTLGFACDIDCDDLEQQRRLQVALVEEAEQLCKHIAIIDQGRIIHNTSMRELLKELHVETFLLDVRQTLAKAPSLGDYPCKRVDEHTLEVQVDKSQSLNALFAALSEAGLEVASLRNKSNRLEELFLALVDENADKRGA